MSLQIINVGQSANDKSGDPLRTAFTKVNANFTELYTTASLPYVKTAYNVVNATATMDTITVSWIFAGSGNHVQYSTLSSSNVTYAYSGMNIIAGVTTSFNSAGTYVMNAANDPNPPWFYGIFNTIGDVQIVYMQDITNSKTYRITATATSTYTGATARGSILIEQII